MQTERAHVFSSPLVSMKSGYDQAGWFCFGRFSVPISVRALDILIEDFHSFTQSLQEITGILPGLGDDTYFHIPRYIVSTFESIQRQATRTGDCFPGVKGAGV